jgi:1-acyl-sn-glycerol-3-phosphate acyltransferase
MMGRAVAERRVRRPLLRGSTALEPASNGARAIVIPGVDPHSAINRATLTIADLLRSYHRHRIRGLSHLRNALRGRRPVLIVGNHCMDIIDPLLLASAVFRETGRVLRFVAHERVFFDVPVLRTLARSWGFVPNGRLHAAEAALQTDRLLVVYPGGVSEALLRSYADEPYRLKWDGRLGFVAVALRQQATVLFVAGVGIDELYYQLRFPIPAPLVRYSMGSALPARMGLGALGPHLFPGFVPFPVRVTHVISPPLALDYGLDLGDRERLASAQRDIWAQCQAFLDTAVRRRQRDSDAVDAACRRAFRLLQRVGL